MAATRCRLRVPNAARSARPASHLVCSPLAAPRRAAAPPAPERFSRALHEVLENLPGVGSTRQFRAGEIIFSAGELGDGLYVIDEGCVQILASMGGSEPRVLATVGEGDFFGEMAALDDAPRSATAKAATDARVTFLSRAELIELLERQPPLALSLIREFSQRVRALNRKYVGEIIQAERLALVGRFTSTIVHDFKNPLTIIGLASELASSDDATPELRINTHDKIARQVERMSNMLEELMEFSRPRARRPTLRGVSFAPYVLNLIEEIGAEIADRGVQIVLSSPPPEVNVRLDPTRMARLFYNLLNNAADAMPDGGTIFLRFTPVHDELRVEIEDTGPGIPPAIMSSLFEPFATHGKPNGTGLGLTICKKIVQDHGGRIWGTTPPGKGAIFCFTLPLA